VDQIAIEQLVSGSRLVVDGEHGTLEILLA